MNKLSFLTSLLTSLLSFVFLAACGGITDTGDTSVRAELPSVGDTTKAESLLFSKNNQDKWMDTRSQNSLALTELFQFSENFLGDFYTDYSATEVSEHNIHSHFLGEGSGLWENYTYSGKMMTTDPKASIGLTFYSDFPKSNSYYRLRRWYRASKPSVGELHVASHGLEDGVEAACNTPNGSTGLSPQENEWVHFVIKVKTHPDHVFFQIKVWHDGDAEPAAWSVTCSDSSARRHQQGTVGVWVGAGSTDIGQRLYKDFKVQFNK